MRGKGCCMYTISVVNQKGGVGKTTTAVSLAAGLTLCGNRVLAVDMDPQANLTMTLLGFDNIDQIEAGPCIAECLIGEASMGDAWVEAPRCDLVPASIYDKRLATIDTALGESPAKMFKLREMLAEADTSWDFCVIDTPPARNTLSYNALTASDGVIIPANASEYSLVGIADLASSLAMVKQYTNPSLAIIGVLMTMHRANTKLAQAKEGDVREMAVRLGTTLFETTIRQSVTMGESQVKKTDIFDYAPNSPVAHDCELFVDEVIKRIASKGKGDQR